MFQTEINELKYQNEAEKIKVNALHSDLTQLNAQLELQGKTPGRHDEDMDGLNASVNQQLLLVKKDRERLRLKVVSFWFIK